MYFVGAEEGPVKIGTSTNLKDRLRTLQNGYPHRLSVLAFAKCHVRQEARYHRRFKEFRLNGEWFERSAPILAEIDKLRTLNGYPTGTGVDNLSLVA